MIRITSKAAGFRRAGIAHPAEPTDYANDTITEQQLALLKAEPMLVVELIQDNPTKSSKAVDAPTPGDAEKKEGK